VRSIADDNGPHPPQIKVFENPTFKPAISPILALIIRVHPFIQLFIIVDTFIESRATVKCTAAECSYNKAPVPDRSELSHGSQRPWYANSCTKIATTAVASGTARRGTARDGRAETNNANCEYRGMRDDFEHAISWPAASIDN
jgi:hypothetical protein